jgi:hypothetical protein
MGTTEGHRSQFWLDMQMLKKAKITDQNTVKLTSM